MVDAIRQLRKNPKEYKDWAVTPLPRLCKGDKRLAGKTLTTTTRHTIMRRKSHGVRLGSKEGDADHDFKMEEGLHSFRSVPRINCINDCGWG